ncbi:MAG: MFS transporter [Planctomycetaceae bacterium]|nr:MFS transporter [Planctomycetaceae bacterium]
MPEPHSDHRQAASEPDIEDPSAWAPLSVPIFRAFWFASIVSNLGTWIHEVGAGWLMTELDSSPEMVSAVRLGVSAPTMLLAIPVGVLADRIDRRRLLIATQVMLFTTTSTLATLTFMEAITSWLLLGLSLLMGVGTVLYVLGWQATVPALVPVNQISRAVALGSMSFNLARSIGPAVGGLLIVFAGVWIAFAANAISFSVVLILLLRWRREPVESAAGLSFGQSMSEGLRFVAGNRTMRHVLIGVLSFLVPATSLWALLPLVAREQLGMQAEGFGLLVTMIGLGAVGAARVLHLLHNWLGRDRTVTLAMIAFAGGLTTLGFSHSGMTAFPATVMVGGAWMIVLTTLNASAQMTLPNKLRARGMGCYMTVMAISMSAGSVLWGQVAGWTGLSVAQWIAAATLPITAAMRAIWFRIESAER